VPPAEQNQCQRKTYPECNAIVEGENAIRYPVEDDEGDEQQYSLVEKTKKAYPAVFCAYLSLGRHNVIPQDCHQNEEHEANPIGCAMGDEDMA